MKKGNPTMIPQDLILVNEQDEVTGHGEKMDVHRKGLLHRAFSVLIADDTGRLLLQKRAPEKYHSAGLWTNACCSHPLRSENTVSAAHRRLQEELGFDCGLNFAFKFIYRAKLDKGLIEHELDHVFTGRYNGPVRPDPSEISEIAWVNPKELLARLHQQPEAYTIWFRIIMERAGELGIKDLY